MGVVTMDKGISYSLEALIAISIVVTSLIFVFSGLAAPQRAGLAFAEENAFSCLRSLDAEGKLRPDASASNTNNINNNVRGCVRGSFNHTTQVCKGTCTSVTIDRDKDTVSAKYYLAGYNSTDPAVVIVYLWSSL